MTTETIQTDGRRRRGDASRARVLAAAVDLASLESLDALSFARLGEAADVSKAGVQGLFKTKEALQLATVDYAREQFIATVVTPAEKAAPGLARLRALIRRWFVYAQEPLFEGGCLRAANMALLDSREGAVRDALLRDQHDWLATLGNELKAAVAAGEVGRLDPRRAAFEIDAVLCATNTALRLGERGAAKRAQAIVDDILAP